MDSNDSITGHVTNVTREIRGDELATAATLGTFVLQVGDVADFNERQPGMVLAEGVLYTYDAGAVDTAFDRITVNEEIGPATLLAGTRVDAWDPSVEAGGDGQIVEWVADIADDDDEDSDTPDEPVQIPIDHNLVDYLGNGIRDIEGESVEAIRSSDGEWWVTRVFGRPPVQKPPAQPRSLRSRVDPQEIPTGVWTNLKMDENLNEVGIKYAGGPGEWTLDPGDHTITAFIRFTDNEPGGRRGLRIRSNGAIIAELQVPPNENDTSLNVSGFATASSPRTIDVQVFQNSGVADLEIAANCRVSIYKLA